ncbi:MAG: hypothetical protein CL496_03000 [Actinobacteria bacterium]|nr:hypothetical protein [Actinomycetota bacterium]
MEKNTYLESINFMSINIVIAVLSGLITVVLALAPNTISGLLRLEYTIQSTGSWFNSSRIVWITSLSITLLALWARYIQEIYAQKILLKFYSFFIGSLAVSNFFGGIENTVQNHPLSLGLLCVMVVLSSICWMKSRGVVPNTKVLNSESKFSVLNSEEQIDYIKESNS